MSAPFTRSKARHVEIIDRAIEEAEFLRDLLLQELGQEEEQDMEVEEPEFPRGKLAKGARKLVNKIGGGKKKKKKKAAALMDALFEPAYLDGKGPMGRAQLYWFLRKCIDDGNYCVSFRTRKGRTMVMKGAGPWAKTHKPSLRR